MGTGLKVIGAGCTLAIALSAYGANLLSSAKTESKFNTGTLVRHLGTVLIGLMYLATVGVTLYCWNNRSKILKYRRKVATRSTYPFPLYTILNDFCI